MGAERTPPPTVQDKDRHLHRRADDPDTSRRSHARWYDSTKMQLSIATALIGLLVGAVAAGYSLRDVIRTIQGTETRWETNVAAETEQWEAIRSNTSAIQDFAADKELWLSVLSEVHCAMGASTTQERLACSTEETRRRLQKLHRSN